VRRTDKPGSTHAWFLSVCLLILSALTIGLMAARGCSQRKAKVNAEVARIHQLISIGMDIDDAVEKLRTARIIVGDKDNPTGDYYEVVVAVRTEHTFLEEFCYTVGIEYDSGLKMYVVIRANLEGVITSME